MVIKKSDQYKHQLKNILEYIAKDKTSAMIQFRKELNISVNSLSDMPYKYRKSYYYNDERIRDMVFRGYTIIYKISGEFIIIVEIFNQNLPVAQKDNTHE
jgi:plasmid stabilization system protein ParE